ncbi:MAG: hypothetical protein A3G87_04960 [Omnitrophica bacterium RIFCSPLOWO2_12_FULL_50_11]|nr:MAG: hypothetical protein A3G87_04960 [Omnitrophica bacterium RIFCSPLOWO2_12_FULL_50_11]
MPSLSRSEYPLLREAGLFIMFVRLTGPKGSCLVRLAVDTGATATMIPPKVALAIGCHPARARAFRETLTASGREFIPLVVVPQVTLFERKLRRVTVACHELPPGTPIDGLLGLDILIPLKALIDLTKSLVRIRAH